MKVLLANNYYGSADPLGENQPFEAEEELLPSQHWSLFAFPQKAREVPHVLIRKSIVWSPFVYLITPKAGLIVAATYETR